MVKHLYLHIPFCSTICSYCDFPKIYYDKCWIDKYLDNIKKEIKKRYKFEVLETIYIGGGTPSSLSLNELKKLFEILEILKKSEICEFTIECNLENLTKEKLDLFKKAGINRLSIGIQTFQKKYLGYLNRKTNDIEIIKYAKKIGFKNINIDLIYAIPGETLEELDKDIDEFLKLDIQHISTYSLMIEPNTVLFKLKEKQIDEELDYNMYKLICEKLKKNGFKHYETSNFSKIGFESKHNLSYWNNECYYGIGMGASGYINNVRYTNTKSITKYNSGIYEYEKEYINEKIKREYEMILGLRKIKGVDCDKFKDNYKKSIEKCFEIENLLKEGKLIKEDKYLRISEDYIYKANEILINFIGD